VVKSDGSISIRFCTRYTEVPRNLQHMSAYVSQHTSVSIRNHTSAHVSILDTPKCHGTCSIRQHTSAYVSAHTDRGACVCAPALDVYTSSLRCNRACNSCNRLAPDLHQLTRLHASACTCPRRLWGSPGRRSVSHPLCARPPLCAEQRTSSAVSFGVLYE
jgi:hypothetical protein